MTIAEAVKANSDLLEVIGSSVKLRQAGSDTWKGLCPFHSEKSPSFSVHPKAGYFHCFGCGQGGDVLKFVMQLDGLTFREALEELAGRYGATIPDRVRKDPVKRKIALLERQGKIDQALDLLLTKL